MRKYTCIATFTYLHESLIIKSLFERELIDFYLENEALIGLIPFSSYAFGGIKLMVHHKDVKRAKQILDSFHDDSIHLKIV